MSTRTLATSATIDTTLLTRAKELLAVPSTPERPQDLRRALDYVAGLIGRHPDITLEHFEHNGVRSLLAYKGARPPRFKVLLNGHVDVVPGTAPQFKPHIENNRLYARGALDMKVATLILTQVFCELAPRVTYPLGLQIVTDEEMGGYGGSRYQYEQGVKTDFYLTGEQSWNDIAVAAKGMCRLKLRYQGQSAHSGYLWRGDNAVVRLTKLVNALLAIYPVPEEEAWVTTVNVARLATISTNSINQVPDAAELHLDIRPIVEDPHFASLESVRTFMAALDPEVELYHATLEIGHHVEATHPALRQLITAAEAAKGAPVALVRRHAQSDLRHYITDPHTAGVEFGLKGKHDHGDGEYLELSSVPIMQEALRKFLISL